MGNLEQIIEQSEEFYLGMHLITSKDILNGLFDPKYLNMVALSYYDSEEQKFKIEYVTLDDIIKVPY